MKKYLMVCHDLKTKMEQDIYSKGSYLPSELQLCQTYNTSRDTIRKALNELTKEGLIQKRQGKGSQVLVREQFNFPVSSLTSYQELVANLGLKSETKLIALDKVLIDKRLASVTGFPEKTLVWRLTRQRIVDGVAAVLDIDYLLKRKIPDMTSTIARQSIYQHIEQNLGLSIDYAQKEITIDTVTTTDQLYLDLGHDNRVVSVKSRVYLSSQEQFQFTESRHKLDKFRFVDFAKRR